MNRRHWRRDGTVILAGCLLLLLLLLFWPTSCNGQEKPDAPKPKRDCRVFIVGTALLAASKTADAITTRQALDRGGVEANPIFGRHPSPAKQAGVNAIVFAGQVLAFHFTERSRKPWLRWVGRVGLGFQIEEHIRAAACNAHIDARSNARQSCAP